MSVQLRSINPPISCCSFFFASWLFYQITRKSGVNFSCMTKIVENAIFARYAPFFLKFQRVTFQECQYSYAISITNDELRIDSKDVVYMWAIVLPFGMGTRLYLPNVRY